jgi:DNA-directed RNA polymerase specialized sigma24 family protein
VRVKWKRSNEDAKDLTQGFFARALEKDFFELYDAAKARFRTFLRPCLDRYVQNEAKALGRRKRGGDVELLSMDFEVAEAELDTMTRAVAADADRVFDQEWVRSVFSLAIDSLRRECTARGREIHFRLFEQHDPSV